MDISNEEIKKNKFSGAAEYSDDESVTFVMSDVFALLSVTERNLYECQGYSNIFRKNYCCRK